ncbi:hypothetical protein OHA72_34980 [Dactylosporangium sp. NBC_01737]|uniref:hypothetical protein n=1 Tax=Dactylosporangium sp. NBC_01737 TaxID=2975959 RepID=UPI002E115944|nr:hypothetical protein OHA72_34980 [Dactylosporangium sp. NBC_01737]
MATISFDRGPFAGRVERPAGTVRHEVVGGTAVRLRSFVAGDGSAVAVAPLLRLGTTVVIRGGPGTDPGTPLRVLRTLRPVHRGRPDAALDQGDETP